MLNIIICEDNKIQLRQIQDIIESEVINLKIDSSIDLATSNPKGVIDYLRENKEKCFIYFLDVDLKADINGIELAKNIRKYDLRGYIVFVTSHVESSFLTFKYKVQAFDYILKMDDDILRKDISECLLQAYNNYKRITCKERKTVAIKYNNKITNFYIDEILFFETMEIDHKLRMHTEKGIFEFYGKLKDIENEMPSNYYRSHRSYLVNTSKIRSVDARKSIIYMINGDSCLVSKRYLKGLKAYV